MTGIVHLIDPRRTAALLHAYEAQCSGPCHQPQGTSASRTLGAERRAPSRVESSDPDMMG
jgi:hypothetical protein